MKVLLGAIALLLPMLVSANTIRSINCKGGYIRIDDTKWALIEKCGTPKNSEIISGNNDEKKEQIIYSYNQKKSVIFTIKKGRIISIEQVE